METRTLAVDKAIQIQTGRNTKTRSTKERRLERRSRTKTRLNPLARKDTPTSSARVNKLSTNYPGCFSSGKLRPALLIHPKFLRLRSPICSKVSPCRNMSSKSNYLRPNLKIIARSRQVRINSKDSVASICTWSSGKEYPSPIWLGNRCLLWVKTTETR